MLEAQEPSLIGGQGLRRSVSRSTSLVDPFVDSEVSVKVRRGVAAILAGARPSNISSRYVAAMLASLRLCLLLVDEREPHDSIGGVSEQKRLDSGGSVEHCWPMVNVRSSGYTGTVLVRIVPCLLLSWVRGFGQCNCYY